MKYKYKLSSYIIMLFVIGCNNNNREQSIESNNFATIISGCTIHVQNISYFSSTLYNKKHVCSTTWQNDSGEKYSINGTTGLTFVKPGLYEFVELKSEDYLKLSYKKYPNAISIFNKVSVKAGDVLYLGHIDITHKDTIQLLKSINLSNNLPDAKNYLKRKYPVLADKLQTNIVNFSKEVNNIKSIFNF